MRQKESKIFGGKISEKGEEVFEKAKINMTAKLCEQKNEENIETNEKLNKDEKYFKPGTEFEVSFIFFDKNKKYIDDYLKAFNALQLFGGIGGRSRRGGGNFVVTGVSELCGIDKDYILEKVYTESNSNKKSLSWHYKKVLGEMALGNDTDLYSNIYSQDAEIYLCRFLGKKVKQKKDKDAPFAILEDLELDEVFEEKVDKRFNYIGKIYKDIRKDPKNNKRNERGASPLVIKVVKDDNICKILLIKFAGNFSEDVLTDEFLDRVKKDESKNDEYIKVERIK